MCSYSAEGRSPQYWQTGSRERTSLRYVGVGFLYFRCVYSPSSSPRVQGSSRLTMLLPPHVAVTPVAAATAAAALVASSELADAWLRTSVGAPGIGLLPGTSGVSVGRVVVVAPTAGRALKSQTYCSRAAMVAASLAFACAMRSIR